MQWQKTTLLELKETAFGREVVPEGTRVLEAVGHRYKIDFPWRAL
jgi:hypothetical protein